MITPQNQCVEEPKPLTDHTENFYLNYPHSNGFIEGGDAIVLGRAINDKFELIRHNFSDGSRETLCRIPAPSNLTAPPYISQPGVAANTERREIFWDVTLNAESPVLIIADKEGVFEFDLKKRGEPVLLYSPEPGTVLSAQVSLRSDGKRMLINFYSIDRNNCGVVEFDRSTGQAVPLLTVPWYASHFHYSPFDEEWMGYCHEGPCAEIPDRVWGWHRSKLPKGGSLFDQYWNDPERRLYMGHERWCFHAPTVLAVAYGGSPGRPRGIYEIYTDGRPARLVSEGDRDWHVGVSHDGRWAVVDTTGPHDAPGRNWENAGFWSDILILDMQTGRREFLARSRHIKHPSHPHPVFSPDGQFIFYNEVDEHLLMNRVMQVRNPWSDSHNAATSR